MGAGGAGRSSAGVCSGNCGCCSGASLEASEPGRGEGAPEGVAEEGGGSANSAPTRPAPCKPKAPGHSERALAASSATAAGAAAGRLASRARKVSTSSSRASFMDLLRSSSFCKALSFSLPACSTEAFSACKAFLQAATSDSHLSSHSRQRRSSVLSNSRVSRLASCCRRLASATSSKARSRSARALASSALSEWSCSPSCSARRSFCWIASTCEAFEVRAAFAFCL
mmetsp:Transcript_162882/g.522254  ORF Transcript_162882/g.522254 Transcript_162882/m.522254 type:complete len:227 (-) Transcript_162882:1411-2091(-)